MIGIYKITNKINGKVYIGLSTNIEKRWIRHRNGPFNPKDKAYNYPLYQAIRKYGLENFIFEVLEECKICELGDKEIYYIALYSADDRTKGYNQDSGGWAARHGKLTEEMVEVIKERIRTSTDFFTEIAKEFGLHENTIQNINSGRTWRMDGEQYPIRGLPVREYHISDMTKSQKRKIAKNGIEDDTVQITRSLTPLICTCSCCGAIITRGAKCCVECARKIQQHAERPSPLKLAEMVVDLGFEETGRNFGVSGSTIKKWCKAYGIPYKLKELAKWYCEQTGAESQILKSINQIDMQTGKILNTFETASAAEKHLGVRSNGNIIAVCNGKRESAYGYGWKFA